MLQYKTFTQWKQDFPPPPADDWLDRVRAQRGRYLRRYNPMGPKDFHKKREITKLKLTQSAMSQLDTTLNKFVTRQPRSFGIDVVERNNLNYTYHRVKATPKPPTPKATNPKVPIPKAPTPKAPTPKAPTPKAPTPEAPVAPKVQSPIVVFDVPGVSDIPDASHVGTEEEKETNKSRRSSGWQVLDLNMLGDSSRQLISTAGVTTRRKKSKSF